MGIWQAWAVNFRFLKILFLMNTENHCPGPDFGRLHRNHIFSDCTFGLLWKVLPSPGLDNGRSESHLWIIFESFPIFRTCSTFALICSQYCLHQRKVPYKIISIYLWRNYRLRTKCIHVCGSWSKIDIKSSFKLSQNYDIFMIMNDDENICSWIDSRTLDAQIDLAAKIFWRKL